MTQWAEFHYDPGRWNTFASWFKRWENTFQHEFSHKVDVCKSRLLLRKFDTNALLIILPKLANDLNYIQTMEQLIFSVQQSLFHIRYNCLKLTKSEAGDNVLYTGLVYPEYENFKLRALTEDKFKYLIFITRLQSYRTQIFACECYSK